MKFGQLIEYNKINIFLQKSSRKKAWRLVPDLLLFFKKVLYVVKASKNKLHKALDYYWSRDMLNFDFLEKGLGIIFQYILCIWFFKKNIFHVIFYWLTKIIVLLSLLLGILGNKCIGIVCFPDCEVINFEINRIFLIKPFFHMTKKSKTKI